MTDEWVYHVDKEDNVIGKVMKSEAWDKKLFHRGASVIVFNSKGEIFVHQRAEIKKVYPLLFDFLAGGWSDYGETYEESAKRETSEELGIPKPDVKEIEKFKYDTDFDKYFCILYYCIYDGKLTLQEEEVKEGSFVSFEELEKMFNEKEFCPDTVFIWNKFKTKINEIRDNIIK